MQKIIIFFSACLIVSSCQPKATHGNEKSQRLNVIFDTDANNELDDQHALAYLLFNGNTFDVAGITVNATRKGGDISAQYAEADRVMKLCGEDGKIPLFTGANDSFNEIRNQVNEVNFDGAAAVNFIIEQATNTTGPKLVVVAVGKLTNLALALEKKPAIAGKIRLVWLGSNYPEPGEYNQDNDTSAVNYVLNTSVDFEMVTVRYGKPSGAGAVQVTKKEIEQKMPGKGPRLRSSVPGRHGGTFDNFGDYSVNLFNHIDYHGDPPSRALFDVVAVAIVKDPRWGQSRQIPAPLLVHNQWRERPHDLRQITIWENFDRNAIIKDFFTSTDNYILAEH